MGGPIVNQMLRSQPAALAAFTVVELALFLSYQHRDGRFHWFLHFFVGASAALMVMTFAGFIRRRPVSRPLTAILAGHLIAMLPDILFGLGIVPHEEWMEIFLLHIAVHFMPGRNWTWYAVFLACLAAYLFTCWRFGQAVSHRTSQSSQRVV